MMMIRFTTQLLPSRSGNLGVILFNNPKPLHALTLEMIHTLQDVLPTWYNDPTMKAILFKSSKESKVPAFCSGGDVRAVYLAGMSTRTTAGDTNDEPAATTSPHGHGTLGMITADFFRYEYQLNHMLHAHRDSGPHQISFWDGIVMGGGVGVSMYGRYRVATERTVWAMPETAIGLFPDVGALYGLTQLWSLSPGMAVYLALTGHQCRTADVMYSGLATHHVSSSKLEALENTLIEACDSVNDNEDVVKPVLDEFHEPVFEQSFLQKHESTIDSIFGSALSDSAVGVEDLVLALQSMSTDTEFCQATADRLTAPNKLSPTSLKVTLEGLRRASRLSSLGEDLQMEFNMCQVCMRPGSDFYPGIRAALIEKDHKPLWNPVALADVTDEHIQSFFVQAEHPWQIPIYCRRSSVEDTSDGSAPESSPSKL